MIRPPSISTRTDTCVPYTTVFRSPERARQVRGGRARQIHRAGTGRGGQGRRVRAPDRSALAPASGAASGHRWRADREAAPDKWLWAARSAEHTSELQSLMRISNAVFRLDKKNK